MDYLAIKTVHVASVTLSASLFLLRGIWMLRGSNILHQRWVKILPHVVDTVLLTSALIMVFWSKQYPFEQNWLSAKLIALLIYIALGSIALKRGRNRTIRAVAFFAALLVLAYIVLVAMTKSVLI